MFKELVLIALFSPAGCSNVHAGELFPDAPEYTLQSAARFKAPTSYEQALQVWRTPEDINGWIAVYFSYDTARALRLSETQRAKDDRFSIYSSIEFFNTKTGVCVDLSRFGVETLRRIDPGTDPKYLMIEFDPIQIQGNTLRLHWVVSFKREGKTYVFCDSKRPGHIAGPYDDPQEFINEYEQYRGRRIVRFQELESYEKQRRTKLLKRQVSERP